MDALFKSLHHDSGRRRHVRSVRNSTLHATPTLIYRDGMLMQDARFFRSCCEQPPPIADFIHSGEALSSVNLEIRGRAALTISHNFVVEPFPADISDGPQNSNDCNVDDQRHTWPIFTRGGLFKHDTNALHGDFFFGCGDSYKVQNAHDEDRKVSLLTSLHRFQRCPFSHGRLSVT